jgi:hypothetical protein
VPRGEVRLPKEPTHFEFYEALSAVTATAMDRLEVTLGGRDVYFNRHRLATTLLIEDGMEIRTRPRRASPIACLTHKALAESSVAQATPVVSAAASSPAPKPLGKRSFYRVDLLVGDVCRDLERRSGRAPGSLGLVTLRAGDRTLLSEACRLEERMSIWPLPGASAFDFEARPRRVPRKDAGSPTSLSSS